jgi:hypothetical protein
MANSTGSSTNIQTCGASLDVCFEADTISHVIAAITGPMTKPFSQTQSPDCTLTTRRRQSRNVAGRDYGIDKGWLMIDGSVRA